MSKNNYNRVTLAPSNEDEKKEFLDFRSIDIIEMYNYGTIIMVGLLFMSIAFLVVGD